MLKRILLTVLVVASSAAFVAVAAFAQIGTAPHISSDRQPLALHLQGEPPSLANAAPGASATSTLTVSNSGRGRGSLHIDLHMSGSAAARAEYEIALSSRGRIVYQGPLDSRLALAVGVIDGRASRSYRLGLHLLPSAHLQGARVGLRVSFSASELL